LECFPCQVYICGSIDHDATTTLVPCVGPKPPRPRLRPPNIRSSLFWRRVLLSGAPQPPASAGG
jgi:hypothetical protein